MNLSAAQIHEFQETLWDMYRQHGRPDLPWRLPNEAGEFDPYHVLVSEIMLQQTQVARVIPKYHSFLTRFPDVKTLAGTQLGAVLREWQGLGYNRRAKFLWQAARELAQLETFPGTIQELTKLPGVGPNTAAAVLVYSFNLTLPFVETNVRTVYIHHFLHDQSDVPDKDVLDLVTQTLEHESPREFFWALMDYGAFLKSTVGNLNKMSSSYAKQSKFAGSLRQIRGQIIRELSTAAMTKAELTKRVPDPRLQSVLSDLQTERLIHFDGKRYTLDSA